MECIQYGGVTCYDGYWLEMNRKPKGQQVQSDVRSDTEKYFNLSRKERLIPADLDRFIDFTL